MSALQYLGCEIVIDSVKALLTVCNKVQVFSMLMRMFITVQTSQSLSGPSLSFDSPVAFIFTPVANLYLFGWFVSTSRAHQTYSVIAAVIGYGPYWQPWLFFHVQQPSFKPLFRVVQRKWVLPFYHCKFILCLDRNLQLIQWRLLKHFLMQH